MKTKTPTPKLKTKTMTDKAKELGNMTATGFGFSEAYNGLTKREHFAGLAMAAIISDFQVSQAICNSDPRYEKQDDGQYNFAAVAALNAIEFADALLEQLSKPE